MSNAAAAFEAMKDRIGEEQGAGDWFTVSQEQIDRFADVTNDHQFIHVDPERAAAETPFGGTIAHGFLTLSMLVHLQESIKVNNPVIGPLAGTVGATHTTSTPAFWNFWRISNMCHSSPSYSGR